MRTEVKIGVLVVLVLLGLVAAYFAFRSTSGEPSASSTDTKTVAPPPRASSRPAPVPAAPVPAGGSPSASSGGAAPGMFHFPGETPTTRPIAAATPTESPASPVPPAGGTLARAAATPAPVVTPPAAGVRPGSPIPGVMSATPPTPAAPKSPYTVAAGDKGFYDISKKVYGDSKYFYLIAKANPSVVSERMTPGIKLVIPPLPVETASGASTRPSSPGGATPGVPGDGMYVVKDNETFWSIAEKQYGNGVYFVKIAEANPKVDPNKLRPGTKLVLPKLTTVSSVTTTRPAVARTAAGGAPAGSSAPVASTTVRATGGPDQGYVAGKPYW
jgi:nucleoid-associated protein YgaU